MIKAIIFDIGGVVMLPGTLHNAREVLAPIIGVSADAQKIIVAKLWNRWRIGKININDFVNGILNNLNIKNIDVNKLKKTMLNINHINKGILPLIKNLKKNYKTIAITNHAREWSEYERKKFKLDDYFNGIFTSYEIKIPKPYPGIFMEALDESVLKPEECIFIDNDGRNVEAARRLGIKGILFRSNDKLRRELKRLGVKI